MPMFAQVPAGDGEALAVRTERRHAAALPVLGRDERSLPVSEIADEGLIVVDEDDRLAVGRPAALRALGDELRLGAVAVHQPDFGKAAAQRRVQDALAVGREARIGVGIVALGELLRVLAAGVHRSRSSWCRCDR